MANDLIDHHFQEVLLKYEDISSSCWSHNLWQIEIHILLPELSWSKHIMYTDLL